MSDNAENILDRCIERMRAGGDPEDVLREDPQAAGDVRPLLALASELQALPPAQPSTAGMMKLIAKLATERQPASRKTRWFSGAVLVRAAAILLCVLFVGWGATAASSNTVRGDFLYPVKMLTERVKFLLAVNPDDKVELRIVFSEERLKEALRKHEDGRGIDKALLVAMLDEAKAAVEGASDLSGARREHMAARVAYMSELQRLTLKQMKERVSEAEREQLSLYVQLCAEQCITACRMMVGEGKHMDLSPKEMISCPMCGHFISDAHEGE